MRERELNSPSRRRLIIGGVILAGTMLFSPHHSQAANETHRPAIMGFNFSPVQCDYLGLSDIFDTYRRALDLKPDYLRLATYPTRPSEETHSLLEEAKDRNIPVILSVGGIKYPRWPEFFAEKELRDFLDKNKPTLLGVDDFVYEKVIKQTKDNLGEFNIYPNITHLQGGNESGNTVAVAGNVRESPKLLQKQLEIINREKHGTQKTMTTFSFSLGHFPFMPDSEKRILMEFLPIIDSVGIHFYSRVPSKIIRYLTAGETDFHRAEEWKKEIEKQDKQVWATEVQGEPYENGNAVHIKQRNYPSFNPERMIELVSELTQRGYQRQLLWGVEHWLWHASQGHDEWINAWRRLQDSPLLQEAA